MPGPRVADVATIGEADGEEALGLVRLSPDGTRLLRMDGQVCVSGLDGSGERCVDGQRVLTDGRFASWSPDGTRLAFTDNVWGYHEADVWVFDVRTGALTNLTDDGVDRIDPENPPQGLSYDAFASWSPDGESIRFARAGDGSAFMALLSIPADGGQPQMLRAIPCRFTALRALVWSADRVAWNCADDAMVWLGEHADTTRDRPVLAIGSTEDRRMLSFSPDGRWLLADSMYATTFALWNGTPQVIPVDGGRARPAADGRIGFPTWVPGADHTLAYVQHPGTLRIVDGPRGEPRTLYTADEAEGPDGVRLSWGTGKLLVHAGKKRILLTIED
ncbi:hypothetical protein BLA60_11860 [Actinophytocola xinjiangensis]|uniref:WD40 repeat protein n=1 Tax=Actinophytocola xinjiangensis TaxID=485602 RepID=A0A7Z1B090_9PSEU|nr:hypothetical protein BLA60_11860 [Actinophytocola xinjiangensis]